VLTVLLPPAPVPTSPLLVTLPVPLPLPPLPLAVELPTPAPTSPVAPPDPLPVAPCVPALLPVELLELVPWPVCDDEPPLGDPTCSLPQATTKLAQIAMGPIARVRDLSQVMVVLPPSPRSKCPLGPVPVRAGTNLV